MALVLFDGFDLYNGTGLTTGARLRWTLATGTNVSSMVAGRAGGQALRLGDVVGASGQTEFRLNFPAIGPNFSVGFDMRVNSLTLGIEGILMYLGQAATTQIYLYHTAGGGLGIFAGASLGETAPGVLTLNTWKHIEICGFINNTTGFIKVYVEGLEVLSVLNIDTQALASNEITTLALRGVSATSDTMRTDWDNLYLYNDSNQHGVKIIGVLTPESDGANLELTPSTGLTHFDKVNETTLDQVDWLTGSTVGLFDDLGLSDLPAGSIAVDGVQLVSYAAKSDAAARATKLGLKSGGDVGFTPNHVLATTPSIRHSILPNDPNTGVPWTYDALQDSELRIEIAA